MAEAVQNEVMYHKEGGDVGRTTLTFRSKQYSFPSLVMDPGMKTTQTQTQTVANPDPMCVLLDVGLVCPHCTGSFTAKFVRRQARLALAQQPGFAGQQQRPPLMLTRDENDAQMDPNYFSQDSDNDSELGFRSGMMKHLDESGINVHITPQSAPEQHPKYAKIVPLSQNQHIQNQAQQRYKYPYQNVQHTPYSNYPQYSKQQPINVTQQQQTPGKKQERDTREKYHLTPEQEKMIRDRQMLLRQSQIRQNKERQLLVNQMKQRDWKKKMPQVGSVYVEEKSSQYVIKHDISNRHSNRRAPPPPPPPKEETHHHHHQHQHHHHHSKPDKSKRSSLNKEEKKEKPAGFAEPKSRKRANSVERSELILKGENIAVGGQIETNLDDFTQTRSSAKDIHGQIRTPPTKPKRLSSRSSDYGSASPTSPPPLDPAYMVVGKRSRKREMKQRQQLLNAQTDLGIPQDENSQFPYSNGHVASVENDQNTKHESLEKIGQNKSHGSWSSDNDIHNQPIPINRLSKQIPPKIPPRGRKSHHSGSSGPPASPSTRFKHSRGSETRSLKSETRSLKSEGGTSLRSRSSAGDTEQENWIKTSMVRGNTPARETIAPVQEMPKDENPVLTVKQTSDVEELSKTEKKDRIMTYLGDQAAINKLILSTLDKDDVDHLYSYDENKDEDYDNKQQDEIDVIEPESTITADGIPKQIRADIEKHGNFTEESSDENDEVFNPEETVDAILENCQTETYSPTSTLSKAFTGPRKKRKKQKQDASIQEPLHEAVASILDEEMRTPSPETVLEEILEDGNAEPEVTDWDNRHKRTTTASLDTTTTTTFTSTELYHSVNAHGSKPNDRTRASPTKDTLEATLNSLNAQQATASKSTSCECIPDDQVDNLSLGRSGSNYDGTSENSENDENQDSGSPSLHTPNDKKTASNASIERIIDKTLYLTDKILAAYPQIEQEENKGASKQPEQEEAQLSDYEMVSDGCDQVESDDKSGHDSIDYQYHGAYDELKHYLHEGDDNQFYKETFDQQQEKQPDSQGRIVTEFHHSKAQSLQSPVLEQPDQEKMSFSHRLDLKDSHSSRVVCSDEEDTKTKCQILDKVTKDLYDIQNSLMADEEKWLIEDFYQDTEMAELESMSDRDTMEKKRLSRQLMTPTSVERIDDSNSSSKRNSLLFDSDSDVPCVPRKVQFWVPQTEEINVEEKEQEEMEETEAFEKMEEQLKEMEQAVKEMSALDGLDDNDQMNSDGTSKEDLRVVDDDQYKSDCTTDDNEQLESSCAEDMGSEIDDVLEAMMMEEQFREEIQVTDTTIFEEVKGPKVQQASPLKPGPLRGPLRYVSPISTSGSESESDPIDQSENHHVCDEMVSEITIPKAQSLVHDVVKRDNMQKSEACITYVNVDGSSSDSIADTPSDDSLPGIYVNRSSVSGYFDRIKVDEMTDSKADNPPPVPPKPDQATIEMLRRSRGSSETDDRNFFQNLHRQPIQQDCSEDLITTKKVEKERCISTASICLQPVIYSEEKNPTLLVKNSELSDNVIDEVMEAQNNEDRVSPHDSTNNTMSYPEAEDQASDISENRSTDNNTILSESTTNVATFETENVLSKEEAQDFLKTIFSKDPSKGTHQESKDLQKCLSNNETTVDVVSDDYVVKEEEVTTQEVTLVFAWPKRQDHELKLYKDPFREIHLRRVTRIKDLDVEVVEGPTVTTIERPPIAAIEGTKSSGTSTDFSGSIPKGEDSIVVKRSEKVTKSIKKRADVEEDDNSSCCDRPLSSDVESELDELLEQISDVSESFDPTDDWSDDYEHLPDTSPKVT